MVNHGCNQFRYILYRIFVNNSVLLRYFLDASKCIHSCIYQSTTMLKFIVVSSNFWSNRLGVFVILCVDQRSYLNLTESTAVMHIFCGLRVDQRSYIYLIKSTAVMHIFYGLRVDQRTYINMIKSTAVMHIFCGLRVDQRTYIFECMSTRKISYIFECLSTRKIYRFWAEMSTGLRRYYFLDTV